MSLDDYKVVLYRNQPYGWVAEIPAIHGCYALMPTREDALAEAGHAHNKRTAEYLTSLPKLGDYLEEGLAAIEDMEEVGEPVSN